MNKVNKGIVAVSLLTLAACGNIPSDINVNGKLETTKTESDKTPEDDKDNNGKKPDKTTAASGEITPTAKAPEATKTLDGTYVATYTQCGKKTSVVKKPVRFVIEGSTIQYYNQVALCNSDYLITSQDTISYDGSVLTAVRHSVYGYPDKSRCKDPVYTDVSSSNSVYSNDPTHNNYVFDGMTLAIEGNVCDTAGNKIIGYYVKE